MKKMTVKNQAIFRRCLSLLLIVMAYGRAEAHPMPNTIVELSVMDQKVMGVAKMPLLTLEDATKTVIEDINSAFIHAYFQQHIQARSSGGTWTTEVLNIDMVTDYNREVGEYKEAVINFVITPPVIDDLRHFALYYDAIVHEVVTHKVYVFLTYDWSNGIVREGESRPVGYISVDVTSGKAVPLEINLDQGSWLDGTKAMFISGMKHIQEGLDHILFLLTLMLIAPLVIVNKKWSGFQGVRYTLYRFLKISFAFTIGHSLTLLVGSFGLVGFNVQFVEVLVALSILISAIHCVRPVFFEKEEWIAGGFGLIHGLAFSISLSGINLGWQVKFLSILGFNLGIEAMQLVIMLCFFPVLLVSRWRLYRILRISFAATTMVISIAWVFERITGQENIITAVANGLL